MQTLRIKITIETSEEETVKVKVAKQISSPATQDEVDAELVKIEEQYVGQTIYCSWNEEQLDII